MTNRTPSAEPTRTFALLGASGLVGGHLARRLAADPAYSSGTLIGRRATGLAPAKAVQAVQKDRDKVSEVVVDFDRLESVREFIGVDVVFCCLGTTIKKAGSQAAFQKVDRDIPVAVAREARVAGARQFLIVTAVGADPASRVFYSRTKGEVELALAGLDFPGGVKAFRPSLIVGERAERRPAERVAMALMGAARPLFAGGLARYRAIDAEAVARAMQRAARDEPSSPGLHVYEGRSLFALSEA